MNRPCGTRNTLALQQGRLPALEAWVSSMSVTSCVLFSIVDHWPLRSVYLFAYEKTIDTSYLKMVKPATHVVGYKYFRKSWIFRYVFFACHRRSSDPSARLARLQIELSKARRMPQNTRF